MALNMPNLINLLLQNTNITTDCTKLFKKQLWKRRAVILVE